MTKFLSTILLLITFFLTCKDIKAQCHLDDWTALKALYENTGGINWTNQEAWEQVSHDEPPSACNLENLYGVAVNENGRVFVLNLGANNLEGTIPVELGNLIELTYLNLAENKLSGSIPASIGNLEILDILYFFDNQLSGQLPSTLGRLNKLTDLGLDRNQLSGSIPPELGDMVNLKTLSLWKNQLSGSIPPELGDMGSLEAISLWENQLSGFIPEALSKLSKLKYLRLNENQLTGSIPPEIGVLEQLLELGLGRNQLIGSIPSELGKLKNIEVLSFYENQLRGNLPAEIGDLTNLYLLNIWGNQLSGCYPENLMKLCSQLNDAYNINGYISSSNNFDISWEDFCKYGTDYCSVPKCNKDDWTALKALYENAGGINWTNQFAWEEVSNNEPTTTCNLENLYGIELNGKGRVEHLNLFNNNLIGFIPTEIENLTELNILDLGVNGLTGGIPTELTKLNNLGEIWLDNNELSGNIPIELANLNNLNYLNVATNMLTGTIPPEIGDLEQLRELNLSRNQLTGSIPPELGKLKNLEVLFIYDNQLSGSLPAEIGDLTNLYLLNIWGNQLSGCYPENLKKLCGQLNDEYNNNSFISNSNNFDISWESFCNYGADYCSVPKCNINDWTVLKALYENAGGINWTNQFAWEEVTSEEPTENCNLENLYGVALNENGRVNVINLSANNLKGYVPAEIGKLENIETIAIYDNQLTGNIPAEIGDLSNLLLLNVWGNQFNGCYPDNLMKLCNQLNGEYNKNSFISSNNNFDITWEDFCNYGVDYCLVPKCNMDDWTALKALYENAGGINWTNQFGWEQVTSDAPPADCNLENLYGVALNENGRVDVLNLSANNLEGNISSGLENLNELFYLNLAENKLSGNIPATLGNLDSLITLKLDQNNLIGIIPPELEKLHLLTTLDLKENQLSGIIPIEFGNLSNLITLNLHKNKLTGPIPKELAQLAQLEYLILWDNELSGEIPKELGDLSNLILLYLAHNKLTGEIPPELGKLKNLIDLGLDTNELTGEIPSELGSMTNLFALSLWENHLTGEIPESLGDLTEMKYLRLNANKLSGKIPSSLGQLSVLEELILSNNKLEDTIPESLGSLSNLTVLTLSQNRLQGNLPDEFNNLTQLEWFDISKNKLSGTIPENIGANKKLYADIRFNYFECEDMHNFKTDEADTYLNSPQCFIDNNIEDRIVIDSLTLVSDTSVVLSMPYNSSNTLSYQWFKNGNLLSGETNPELMLNNIASTDAGKYKIRVENACEGITFFSDDIYIIIEGYDLNGQPVESNQIMVEFQNEAEKNRYARKFMDDGIYIDTLFNCNCNRELYLWEFNNTEDAVEALLTIDKKVKKIKKKSKVSGGFNNLINIGEQAEEDISYNVLPNTDNNQQYLDSVLIYIIDSGLDDENFDTNSITIAEAPKDDCHQIDAALGYSYLDKHNLITNNYKDDLWHGTFGFRSIANGFPDDHNIKIVPLKVFNSKGEGSLFKLVCALYHAIDNGADIINLSAGYQGQSSDILENAINAAREKGIFIVTAAGNEGINMNEKDTTPQYPANFASKYHYFFDTIPTNTQDTVYTSMLNGLPKLDSIIYDNIISVASIDNDGEMSPFSNYGKESATLAAYGENINSYGLGGMEAIASGTSMATYFVTGALALEIATNNKRTYKETWKNFVDNCLIDNNALKDYTRTGKQLNARLVEVVDKCNQADWSALKALYFNTNGKNWKNKNGWEIVTKDSISGDCNLEILFGVELNEYGRVANINLYNNNLSGSIPKELEQLTKLEGLYLAANYLSGNIPYQLGSLTKLKNLILSANNLSGSIPIQLSNLSKLERLYLSYNQLTGKISLPFHNLSSLKYLFLNNNKLTGSMPVGLAQLNKLIVLTINHNQFTGCYGSELKVLCDQLRSPQFKGNSDISDANNFVIAWENFCTTNEGVCIEEKNTLVRFNEKIKVYPNPSTGFVTIQFLKNENYQMLSISNLAGKQMLKRDIKNLNGHSIELDLTQLAKGMYVIEVQGAINNFTQKIILK